MAKVLFGPIVSEARNKEGSVVFSRGPYGAYTRAWVMPDETPSARRTLVWDNFAIRAARWSTVLTEAQRQAWRDYALTHPRTDRFGNPQIWSGLHMYLSFNMIQVAIYGGFVDTPPPTTPNYTLLNFTASASASGAYIRIDTFTPESAGGWALLLFATAQQNVGRKCMSGLLRWLTVKAHPIWQPWDFTAEYTARWGALVAGKNIGLSLRWVDQAYGWSHEPLRLVVTVAA